MTQNAVPTSDTATGNWTTAPLWSKIDEIPASDSDYITLNNSTASNAQFAASSITDPVENANHWLRCRAYKAGTGAITLAIRLYQGASQICTSTVTLPTSWGDVDYHLTTGEADAITDYSALSLVLIGTANSSTRYIYVSNFHLETPDAPVSTPSINISESAISVGEGKSLDGIPNPSTNQAVLVDESKSLDGIPNPSLSQAVSVSENPVIETDALAVNTTKAISVADSPLTNVNIERSASSGITIGESIAVGLGVLEVNKSETVITVGDSKNLSLVLDIDKSETVITIGESQSLLCDLNIGAGDSTTVGETISLFLDLNIGNSDSTIVTDTPDVELGAAGIVEVNKSEDVAVGETTSAFLELDASSVDNITVGETASALPELNIGNSDSTIVDDEPIVELGAAGIIEVNKSEDITVGETTSEFLELDISDSDSLVVAETTSALPDLNIGNSDGATITDTPNVELAASGSIDVNKVEDIAVGENTNTSLDLNIGIGDSTTISDTTGFDITLAFSSNESITISDIGSAEPTISISTSQNVTANENSSTDLSIDISQVSSIHIVDTPATNIQTLFIAQADNISVTDSCNAAMFLVAWAIQANQYVGPGSMVI